MPGFDTVVGQEQIVSHLQKAIETKKISHAYIINGDRAAGKEYIASVFARTLLCEKGGINPCEQCHSCKQALSANHPDIIRVTHEKPNSVGVDDVRDQINNSVWVKPYSSPYKVYIMNEAEKMTTQAQNALLKTLEEPPEYVVILLLTTNVNMLLSTIQSRCVVLNMKPVSDELVRDFIINEYGISMYKADECAAFARGNIGKARLLATSEEFDKVRQEAIALFRCINEMDLSGVIEAVKNITNYNFDINDYLDIIAAWYRDVLMFKATNDPNTLIFKEEIQLIKKRADKSTYEGIQNVIEALDTAKARLTANVNFDLTMELLLLAIKEN